MISQSQKIRIIVLGLAYMMSGCISEKGGKGAGGDGISTPSDTLNAMGDQTSSESTTITLMVQDSSEFDEPNESEPTDTETNLASVEQTEKTEMVMGPAPTSVRDLSTKEAGNTDEIHPEAKQGVDSAFETEKAELKENPQVAASPTEVDKGSDGEKRGEDANGDGGEVSGESIVQEDSTVDEVTAVELADCAKRFPGRDIVRIKLQDISKLAADQVAFVKIGKHHGQLTINVKGSEKMRGLCVLAKGERSKVQIVLEQSVGEVHFVGEGKDSSGEIEVKNHSKVDKLHAEIEGKDASLDVSGMGRSACAKAHLEVNEKSGAVHCD